MHPRKPTRWPTRRMPRVCEVVSGLYRIGIYPTTKVSGPKHPMIENKHKSHANSLHTFRIWSITWSQFILSGCSKHWLIRHSMASTAIYSSCEYGAIKDGRPSLDSRSVRKPVTVLCHFIPSKSLLLHWLFNLPLVAQ